MRAHTRPFECPIPECRRRFGWSVDMKRHIEKIHNRHFSEFPGCLNVPPPSEIEFPGPPGRRLTLADALSPGGMDVPGHSARGDDGVRFTATKRAATATTTTASVADTVTQYTIKQQQVGDGSVWVGVIALFCVCGVERAFLSFWVHASACNIGRCGCECVEGLLRSCA